MSIRRTARATLALLSCAAFVVGCAHRAATRPAASAPRAPRAELLEPAAPALNERAPEQFRVAFETTAGDFVVEVHRDWAPHGVDRFYGLVRHGFYDDQAFFRVREKYIAQFGLHGDPTVIATWKGARIPDDPRVVSNTRGTLAYAFAEPNGRTTQIYINLVDNTQLDAQGFAPFGRIVRGLEVIDRLYAGYGESAGGGIRGGKQGPIEQGGNAYLRREFPRLDYIRRAKIVP